MSTTIHELRLVSKEHFGKRLPPHHIGYLLSEMPVGIQQSISMALRNRSTSRGKRPEWLKRAADIRLVDLGGNGQSVLFFEARTLGEAAWEIYQQPELFETRPDANDTGFDLFADVLGDLDLKNADSIHYDPSLLARLVRFKRVFHKGPFEEIAFTSRRYKDEHAARLSSGTAEAAKQLLGKTPSPHQVRLVGQLDGLEASTQRFSLLLDNGEKVVGVFQEEQLDSINQLWRKRVLVLGKAVYRASKRLLRIDAETITLAEHEKALWSRMPQPTNSKIDLSRLRRPQGPRSGMAAIVGRWPGDESDEEIQAALERLS